jgi:hypothetical protein
MRRNLASRQRHPRSERRGRITSRLYATPTVPCDRVDESDSRLLTGRKRARVAPLSFEEEPRRGRPPVPSCLAVGVALAEAMAASNAACRALAGHGGAVPQTPASAAGEYLDDTLTMTSHAKHAFIAGDGVALTYHQTRGRPASAGVTWLYGASRADVDRHGHRPAPRRAGALRDHA